MLLRIPGLIIKDRERLHGPMEDKLQEGTHGHFTSMGAPNLHRHGVYGYRGAVLDKHSHGR